MRRMYCAGDLKRQWLFFQIVVMLFFFFFCPRRGFPGGSAVQNWPANAGDTVDAGLISGLRRSPGAGNGNPLQYSCLENPMDRGVLCATVHGVTESDTTEYARVHKRV